MHPDDDALVSVTAADREAAAGLVVPHGRWPGFPSDFLSGRADANSLTQTLARHRLAASSAPSSASGEVERQFSIQERDDDMLLCERDWQFGWRCIARRPKLVSNEEWRATAERVAAALRTPAPAETQEVVEALREFYDDWCKGAPDPKLRDHCDKIDAALARLTPADGETK